jgi:Fe-S oxidoreductase
MSKDKERSVDHKVIQAFLDEKKTKMKLSLSACASCSLCAESCFMFNNNDSDPKFMPSYKALKSLGVLYKKKGKVSFEALKKMGDLIWKNCVLCGRCYCAVGIDIPDMIAFTRMICRSQDVDGVYPHNLGAPPESDEVLIK